MPIQYQEEKEHSILYRDNDDPQQVNQLYDWMLRRYFPDEVDRLQGDADYIGFHTITFHSDGLPEVEYSTWNKE